jgi:hypothetical protein
MRPFVLGATEDAFRALAEEAGMFVVGPPPARSHPLHEVGAS